MSNTFEKTLRNWAAYDGPKAYQDALLQAHREAVAEAEGYALSIMQEILTEKHNIDPRKAASWRSEALDKIKANDENLTPTAGGEK